jgi:chromate transporter
MPPAAPADIRLRDLFLAFLQLSLSGFGGVLGWTHQVFVENRHWLDEEEFAETMGFCQFLPGPNIVNFAVCLGRRSHGPRGALVALAGVVAVPLALFIGLGALYTSFAHLGAVHGALGGISAAAAGLVISMGTKMARPLLGRLWPVGIGALAFTGMGLLHWPLLSVLASLAPASIAIAWLTRAWLRP